MKISNKWWYRLKSKLECFLFGHDYTTEIIQKNQNWLDTPIKKRTYCKRCGKKYRRPFLKRLLNNK